MTFRIINAIDTKRPGAFLLENFMGLVTHRPETLRIILGRLRAVGGGVYDVGYRVLDTADHGLPQRRERVFIVGLRKRTNPGLCAGPGQHTGSSTTRL